MAQSTAEGLKLVLGTTGQLGVTRQRERMRVGRGKVWSSSEERVPCWSKSALVWNLSLEPAKLLGKAVFVEIKVIFMLS